MASIKEVADYIAATENISKASAERIVKGVFEFVGESLSNGEEVNINGFGKFEVTARAERQGRNPATGEALTIAAKSAPKFKAGKALKDKVAGK